MYPDIKDRLKNALELFRYFDRNDEHYSLELVDDALFRVHESSQDIDFAAIIDKRRIRSRFFHLLLIAGCLCMIMFTFTNQFSKASHALFHPESVMIQDSLYKMEVYPGDIEVVKHDDVKLQLLVTGGIPPFMKLLTSNLINGQENEIAVQRTETGHYRHTITGIRDSTSYYFYTEDCTSDTHLISVIEYPLVRNLQLKLFFPAYTKLPSKLLDENIGDIAALKGTKVDIKLSANKTIGNASLVYKNNPPTALKVTGHRAEGSMIIMMDDSYHIKLHDQSHRENIDPIKYTISMVEDEYPRIKILSPGRDVDIDEAMRLKLSAGIYDDYGISRIRLVYQKVVSNFSVDDSLNYEPISFDVNRSREFQLDYEWKLTGLDLFPEDVIAYYLEVFDNDVVSGPKSTKSSTYRIRFPSTEEIFAEVERGYDATLESYEGMYQQSKEIKDKLEKIVQEMKRTPELAWEEKKVLEEIAEDQMTIQQSLGSLEKNIGELVDKLETHDLISLELVTKFQELQELMNDVMTDEMKEALKKLQENIQSIDPEQLQKVIEKLDINQQELLEKLERNIELMKRLQIERKLDELVKKSEELLTDQMNLLKQAEQSNDREGDMLSQKENDINRRAEELKKELADLRQAMEQFPEMPAEKIDAALDHIDASRMNNHMQQSSQNFKQGNMQSGMKSGELAENALSELNTMLQQAKQELLQSQLQHVLDGLKNLSQDLLQVSKKQEVILNESEGLNISSSSLPAVADRQQDLASGLMRVIDTTNELSHETFFMSSSVATYIGLALAHMNQSVRHFEERSLSAVNRMQKQSMVSLNEAVKEIRKTINELNSASSASGLEQMMQMLQQMSCQQQGINQSTLQLGLSGQMMSLQQQAAMARLAAEQAALQKTLQELEEEYGNRADILGRLDRLAEEMEEVVNDLNSQNITRKTIQRQREILSRLLDAQKSVRKREFSKQRQAETAKAYDARDPGVLPGDLGEKNQELRRDLLNLQNEGYKKDFEELIQKYFEEIFRDGKID